MSDVVLVQMPYASVQRPSIALGLLKSYLTKAGMSTKVLYSNIEWAEEVGLDMYRLSDGTLTPHLVGEWTFAGAAFPGFEPDHDAFFRLIKDNATMPYFLKIRALHPGATMAAVLKEVRRHADGFVDRVARSILAERPRIVGCTSMFQQHCACLALLRRIRELDPDVVTMMGGANCEGPMGKATHDAFDWVDFVVSGEADGFIADLCRTVLERGRELPAALLPEGVAGPAHRRARSAVDAVATPALKSGTLIMIGAPSQPIGRAVVHSLDDTSIPDYDEFFDALNESPVRDYVEPGLLIETSRGCWWGAKHHCTFCGLNGSGMVYRSKSPARALAEIDYLTERHGVRQIEFVDNILDMGYVDTVLPQLAARDEPLSMFFEVKANLKRKHLEAFAKAGIRAMQPGIENLHAEALQLIDKGNSAVINVQLMKWAKELGIDVHWNFLVLIPGECDEWYEQTATWLPLVQHLAPPMNLVRLRFDRFSMYHEQPERWGLELAPYRTYAYVYPVPMGVLSDLAYFFESKEDLARDDVTPAMMASMRPGLEAVRELAFDWMRVKHRPPDQRPVLMMTDGGEELRIRDTRSVATRSHHVLRGLARQIYLTCDEAIAVDGLVTALNRRFGLSATWSDVAPVVDDLVKNKLMLPIESRYLSLATWEGRDVAATRISPFGGLDFERAVQDLAARSLAAACRPSPDSVSVQELFAV